MRALEVEIDAVAYTVQQAKNAERNENHSLDGNDNRVQGEDVKLAIQASPNSLTLQHALAADRLRSLKKTKAKLEKELADFQREKPSNIFHHDKVIKDLVKEEAKPQKRLKEISKPGKVVKNKKKAVSFADDVDFDAVLDAAAAGFVETVSLTSFSIATAVNCLIKNFGDEERIQYMSIGGHQSCLNL